MQWMAASPGQLLHERRTSEVHENRNSGIWVIEAQKASALQQLLGEQCIKCVFNVVKRLLEQFFLSVCRFIIRSHSVRSRSPLRYY